MCGSDSGGSRRTRPGQQMLDVVLHLSLEREEPKRYRLDLVGLPPTHSPGSGPEPGVGDGLCSVAAQGVRCQAGVEIHTSPRLCAASLKLSLVDQNNVVPMLKEPSKKAW